MVNTLISVDQNNAGLPIRVMNPEVTSVLRPTSDDSVPHVGGVTPEVDGVTS